MINPRSLVLPCEVFLPATDEFVMIECLDDWYTLGEEIGESPVHAPGGEPVDMSEFVEYAEMVAIDADDYLESLEQRPRNG